MTRPTMARTAIARRGHARALEVRRELARAVHESRRDAGLSARALALAAGVSTDTVLDIEAASRDHGMEVVARVVAALGGHLRIWFDPGAGIAIHDRYQAGMVSALFSDLHGTWRRATEVLVTTPVRGVIDAVLQRTIRDELVATESESTLRRIEQQIRWGAAKAESLALARGRPAGTVSRLLLLRTTSMTRAAVATYPDLVRVAFPGRITDALAALHGEAPWPGATVLWCETRGDTATILDRPPRGIDVGR